ncbi:MAG: FeoA family protein [Halothiobacillaceae bacterium]
MSTTMDTLSVGDSARIVGYTGASKVFRRKLLSMGLTPGTEFEVIRCAPMGDPMELRVREFLLSIRRDEAVIILVEKRS